MYAIWFNEARIIVKPAQRRPQALGARKTEIAARRFALGSSSRQGFLICWPLAPKPRRAAAAVAGPTPTLPPFVSSESDDLHNRLRERPTVPP